MNLAHIVLADEPQSWAPYVGKHQVDLAARGPYGGRLGLSKFECIGGLLGQPKLLIGIVSRTPSFTKI